MNVCNFFSDGFSELNSSVWRGIIPQRAFHKAGHRYSILSIHRWLANDEATIRACAEADIIIVQRVAVDDSIKHMQYWRNMGKAVVCDIDDDYARIQEDNQAFRYWGKGEVEVGTESGIMYPKILQPHPIKQLQYAFSIGAGTSPGKMLVEDWKPYGPMYWVPNYIDSERYLSVPKPQKDKDWITILYGSSMSHVPSFEESGIEPALANVFRKRKNVRFILCGDERVYKRLPIPADRKRYQRYVRATDWPKIMAQADITLAPLARKYDMRRSDIKCSEAFTMGIPIVATGGPVYEEFEKTGIGLYVKNGVFDDSTFEERVAEWEEKLLEVVDNLEYFTQQAKEGVDFAYQYRDVDVNVGKIVEIYQQIMERLK